MSPVGHELPDGWITTTLGNLVRVVRGVSYKKVDARNESREGLVPILRATNIGQALNFRDFVYVPDKYVKHEQMLQQGDIIIAASSGSRAVVGKAAQLRHDWTGSFGAFCFTLRPDRGLIEEYIAWFLQTQDYRTRVSKLSAGVNINNLKRESLVVERPDFWATSSNKQLNFLQHVRSLLEIHGRAAIVVPDNVLFEGGAGETVRRHLLNECDVHTLLRLPTGIFYAQGVKANVLFFDRKPASETPWTRDLWIYDLRTNRHFTLKTNPLTRADLDDFVACYNPEAHHERQETERFHRFSYEDLMKRDKVNLDIFWLRDESMEDSANLPPPDEIAEEIVEDLRAALEQLEEIAMDLSPESAP